MERLRNIYFLTKYLYGNVYYNISEYFFKRIKLFHHELKKPHTFDFSFNCSFFKKLICTKIVNNTIDFLQE